MKTIRTLAFVFLVCAAPLAIRVHAKASASAMTEMCSYFEDCDTLAGWCDDSCQGPPVFYGMNQDQSYCYTAAAPDDSGDWTCFRCMCNILP